MTIHTSSESHQRMGLDNHPKFTAERVTRYVLTSTEIAAACLLLIEVVVLFIGLTARYAFNRPLLWTDEVASILFLWLAMLGAVVAYGKGEHMRMTAIIDLGDEWARLAANATPYKRSQLLRRRLTYRTHGE
jgi:TRAP-type C4-dicarboxylate transport system permease small subunit